MALFYISCPLLIEKDLLNELKEIWPFLNLGLSKPHPLEVIEVDKGGILIQTPEEVGFRINYYSKLAHRILYRWLDFKVRDFPKLYQKLRKTSLLYYGQNIDPSMIQLEISAQKSRLNNEKRIGEVFQKAWGIQSSLQKLAKNQCNDSQIKIRKENQISLYVRMYEDRMTLSWDTTGSHLHFRGNNKVIGKAPLRSNLAAWAIYKISEDVCSAEMQKIHWIDPLAGSGTLLLEVAHFFTSQKGKRQFTFEKFFSFDPEIFSSQFYPRIYSSLWAFDWDPKMINILKENFSKIQDVEIDEVDLWSSSDNNFIFSKINKINLKGEVRWVITNPPYGKRIKSSYSLSEWVSQIEKKFAPERIAIFHPTKIPPSDSGKKWKSYLANNGGIPIWLHIGLAIRS